MDCHMNRCDGDGDATRRGDSCGRIIRSASRARHRHPHSIKHGAAEGASNLSMNHRLRWWRSALIRPPITSWFHALTSLSLTSTSVYLFCRHLHAVNMDRTRRNRVTVHSTSVQARWRPSPATVVLCVSAAAPIFNALPHSPPDPRAQQDVQSKPLEMCPL